jgi:poly-gamma-glutamate synthesis protein (capsule biosynthesis protein)
MAEGSGTGAAGAPARIAFLGDLVLARRLTGTFRAGKPPEDFWGNTRERLAKADAVIANLETPITDSDARWPSYKTFLFRADPGVVDILRAGSVTAVALANNHILDFTEPGLVDTRRHLAAAGIAHTGAGRTLAEAREPALFPAGRRTVGMVAITDQLRMYAAGENRAGTFFVDISDDRETGMLIGRLADDLHRRGADIRVLACHWGPNWRHWTPPHFRRFAHRAIEAGFDVFHGHSAHLLQGIEFHKRGLILYDCGDFLDDFWSVPFLRMDRSFLFEVTFAGSGPPSLRLTPVSLVPSEVNFATGAEAERIRRVMLRRSRNFAVEFARDGEAMIARPPGHRQAIGAVAPSMVSASSTANSSSR